MWFTWHHYACIIVYTPPPSKATDGSWGSRLTIPTWNGAIKPPEAASTWIPTCRQFSRQGAMCVEAIHKTPLFARSRCRFLEDIPFSTVNYWLYRINVFFSYRQGLKVIHKSLLFWSNERKLLKTFNTQISNGSIPSSRPASGLFLPSFSRIEAKVHLEMMICFQVHSMSQWDIHIPSTKTHHFAPTS